jgi:hypothetical protein
MDVQREWWRCSICQGLVNTAAGNGGCIGGGMHEFQRSAEYKAAWGTVEPGAQPGWGWCKKCGGLAYKAGNGPCWDNSPHDFGEYAAEYNVAMNQVPGNETGWRWCSQCQRLWNANHPDGQCVIGGPHTAVGSAEYTVPVTAAAMQAWWYWCEQCLGLIRGPNMPGCVDNSTHQASGTTYRIAYGAAATDTQQGWRYCWKCTALVFGDGPCFVGDRHDYLDSLVYSLPVGVELPDAQPGWRWCSKCQVLTLASNKVGRCAAGGEHDQSGSGKYSVYPDSMANGQPGWRLCKKCRTMTLASVSPGHCHDGGLHDLTGSAAYQVQDGYVPAGGNGPWRWCSRCQGLAYGGSDLVGTCFDAGPHDFSDSNLYGVPVDYPPDGGQPGWKRCTLCAKLVLPAEDDSTGLCVGGISHNFAESPAVTMAMTLPLAPPDEVFPEVVVTESEAMVVVDGTGFSTGAAVELSFVVGAVTTKVSATTDETGAFHAEQQPVVPAPAAGGLVIARESADKVASGRLKSFVPAPPA